MPHQYVHLWLMNYQKRGDTDPGRRNTAKCSMTADTSHFFRIMRAAPSTIPVVLSPYLLDHSSWRHDSCIQSWRRAEVGQEYCTRMSNMLPFFPRKQGLPRSTIAVDFHCSLLTSICHWLGGL